MSIFSPGSEGPDIMEDRSLLVARLVSRHPRFAEAGRGRLGLTSGAAKMAELAMKQWPDLTMAEFAAGVASAAASAKLERETERAARVVGERWR